ncbi:CRE-CPNA-1 protein, partial [Aphelenchoides avenae]
MFYRALGQSLSRPTYTSSFSFDSDSNQESPAFDRRTPRKPGTAYSPSPLAQELLYGDMPYLQRTEELPSSDLDVSRVSSFSYKASPEDGHPAEAPAQVHPARAQQKGSTSSEDSFVKVYQDELPPPSVTSVQVQPQFGSAGNVPAAVDQQHQQQWPENGLEPASSRTESSQTLNRSDGTVVTVRPAHGENGFAPAENAGGTTHQPHSASAPALEAQAVPSGDDYPYGREKRQHPVDAVAIVRSSEPPGASPVSISALIPEEERREERPFVVPFEEPHLSKSEEPEKPKEIDPREAEKVLQLLQEYDLEVNIPEQARQVREHRPSPSPHGDDGAQRGANGATPYAPSSPQGFDIVNLPAPHADKPDGNVESDFQFSPYEQPETPKATAYNAQLPVGQLPVLDVEENYEEVKRKTEEVQRVERTFVSQQPLAEEDPRRLVEADIYLQDAIEYVDTHHETQAQTHSGGTGGFIIEEEMLDSDKQQHKPQQQQVSDGQFARPSVDPTSRLVGTNEAFDKPDTMFDDADDAVTYAPEIQTVEIPPDQLSQNSSNLIENISEQLDAALPLDASIPELRKDQVVPETPSLQAIEEALKQQPLASAEQPPAPMAPQFWRPGDDTSSVSSRGSRRSSRSSTKSVQKQSSLLSALGVTSMQEMLLRISSLDELSQAMRKAGLESTNLIFGIDYTASNKYQGEHSFYGRSLHSIEDPTLENPYQQCIKIMGRTLAPFATTNGIPVFGFGDASTGDWSVFPLKGGDGACKDLDEVLRVYNDVTPTVDLSGPTNFAPLIYQAMEVCSRLKEYHILVIIADGQVTNERATRKAIVHACQFPLSIIVVGVGDGPWDMMK